MLSLKGGGAFSVSDNKGKALHVAARGLVLASIAAQMWGIASTWWTSDPRVSCDRLLYWGEWIDCLHGKSHFIFPWPK
jgi:hypothetical protein